VLLACRIELSVALRICAKVAPATDPTLIVVAVAEVSAVVVIAIVLSWIGCLQAVIADIPDTIEIKVRLILVRNLHAVVIFVENAVTVAIG
jgi:hypothetical protein